MADKRLNRAHEEIGIFRGRAAHLDGVIVVIFTDADNAARIGDHLQQHNVIQSDGRFALCGDGL